ncbi:MAG: hypothetical protein HQ526_07095 [Actinobacteria bacterium]|nr:hypothetical protein [Actinomycetota bacterium]
MEPRSEPLPRQSAPSLLPGTQLVQTAADVVHLVGDVGNPVSVAGVSSECVRWLSQVDGQLSRDAQIWHAEALGVSPEIAEAVLTQLETYGLVVDTARAVGRVGFAEARVFGEEAVTERLGDLVPSLQPVGPVPSPRRNPDWRVEGERLADDVGAHPAVVVLAQPRPSSAEVDFTTQLLTAGIPHLVVAAGIQSARVGPYTAASGGPCLRCDSLAHTDADGVWRHIGAQLSVDEGPVRGRPSRLMATLAAAEAVRQMAAVDAGDPGAAENAVMQSGYRGGAWRRRLVVRHQQCSCWWPQSAA